MYQGEFCDNLRQGKGLWKNNSDEEYIGNWSQNFF